VIEAGRPSVRADDEPISPELALVDADLARRHRERLADPPWVAVAREPTSPAVERSWIDEVRRGLPAETESAAAPARQERRRLRRAVPFGLTALLGAGIGVAFVAILGDGGKPRLLPPAPASPATPTTPAVTTGSRPTAATRTRPSGSRPTKRSPPASPTKAGTETTQVQTRRTPPAAAAPPPAPPAAPKAATPRTFAWVAVPGASHYRVEFYRGRTRIFRAYPGRARIVVPGRWMHNGATFSFAPGRYRWVVRAGFGPRSRAHYGPPLVSSAWVVPRSA
jgi:hypothetical protein